MSEVGVRALKQNASAVVAAAVAGEVVVITDRGRPVAQLTGLATTGLGRLLDAGLARPPRMSLVEALDTPLERSELSAALAAQRDAERF